MNWLNCLKMYKKIRFYISPFFISKHYLLKDIMEIVEKYKFKRNTLDVGCGEKPYQYLFKNGSYKGIDFKSYSKNKDFKGCPPDFYFNDDYLKTLRLPFKDESFDNIVCFQVLEHHKNPQKMIQETIRIVKKDGYILITAPFLGGVHEQPNDFQRFTMYGLTGLFERFGGEILEIKKQGSIFSTFSILLNEYLNIIAGKNKVCYFLCSVLYPPFLLFEYFSYFADKIFKSEEIYFNNLVLAKRIK